MKYEDLSPEIKEKAKACTTSEELLALANEVGIELSDEELDTISAGGDFWGCSDYCSNQVCQKVCSSSSVATRPITAKAGSRGLPVSLM